MKFQKVKYVFESMLGISIPAFFLVLACLSYLNATAINSIYESQSFLLENVRILQQRVYQRDLSCQPDIFEQTYDPVREAS